MPQQVGLGNGKFAIFPDGLAPEEMQAELEAYQATPAQRVLPPLAKALTNVFGQRDEFVPVPAMPKGTFGLSTQAVQGMIGQRQEAQQFNAQQAMRQRVERERALEMEKDRAQQMKLEDMREKNARLAAERDFKNRIAVEDYKKRSGWSEGNAQTGIYWLYEDDNGQIQKEQIVAPVVDPNEALRGKLLEAQIRATDARAQRVSSGGGGGGGGGAGGDQPKMFAGTLAVKGDLVGGDPQKQYIVNRDQAGNISLPMLNGKPALVEDTPENRYLLTGGGYAAFPSQGAPIGTQATVGGASAMPPQRPASPLSVEDIMRLESLVPGSITTNDAGETVFTPDAQQRIRAAVEAQRSPAPVGGVSPGAPAAVVDDVEIEIVPSPNPPAGAPAASSEAQGISRFYGGSGSPQKINDPTITPPPLAPPIKPNGMQAFEAEFGKQWANGAWKGIPYLTAYNMAMQQWIANGGTL